MFRHFFPHAAQLVCKRFPSCCRNCCNITTLDSPTASPILQVSKEQFDKILDMCKQGEEQGAKLECGGKRLGDKGYYIEPTVFSNVQDDNIIATDEIFGPVQSILKWKTVEEVTAPVRFFNMLQSMLRPKAAVSFQVEAGRGSDCCCLSYAKIVAVNRLQLQAVFTVHA